MNKNSPAGGENPDSNDLDQLSQVLNRHLDERVESLDYNVTHKLAAARHRALAEAGSAGASSAGAGSAGLGDFPHLISGRWKVLSAGIAMGAVLLFTGYTLYEGQSLSGLKPMVAESQVMPSLIEDMQLLSSTDDLEFFQSLELLEWMENEQG